ncbi:cytochrome c(L), periplasmic [Methyloceanibacter methanicus]|nr:cytochrome c(L), periplasmic [Methyloceanibacter methanicus]
MALAQQIQLVHTITGMPLDLSLSPENGRDTPAVKESSETGVNPYNGVESCMHEAEEVYLTACSGCHGHIGEGKLGPGLNDDYWTYPKNQTDKGLFETIYGGARSMMGPQASARTMDEILLVIAWIRHLYKGDVEGAVWLTDEQKANFVAFDPDHHKPEAEELECEIPAQ